MKKAKFFKTVTSVVAFLMVFVIATTAFAWTRVDYATWNSTVCLNGFTTTQSVVKNSSATWAVVFVYVDKLEFASVPEEGLEVCINVTPRNSSGVPIGDTIPCDPYTWPAFDIDDNYQQTANKIFLRIDNPHPGNNVKSNGEWDGYIE